MSGATDYPRDESVGGCSARSNTSAASGCAFPRARQRRMVVFISACPSESAITRTYRYVTLPTPCPAVRTAVRFDGYGAPVIPDRRRVGHPVDFCLERCLQCTRARRRQAQPGCAANPSAQGQAARLQRPQGVSPAARLRPPVVTDRQLAGSVAVGLCLPRRKQWPKTACRVRGWSLASHWM